MIKTIRLERIFADKIFAAEFYNERALYFDVAKHLYDVSIMLDLEQIQGMIGNRQMFLEMLGYKRLEETRRTGSDLAEKKFSDFQLLRDFAANDALRKDYQNMQRNYVFAIEDVLSEYSTHLVRSFRGFGAGHPEIRCSDSGCQCSPL